MLEASLIYKHKRAPLLFLVDSGADYTHVDKDVALWLGVSLEKAEVIASHPIKGNVFKSYLFPTKIDISGHQLTIPICYTKGLGLYRMVIGQEGFFDKFRVVFEKYKNRFELTPKF